VGGGGAMNLVLWSGGNDSTLVLHDLLQNHWLYVRDGEIVPQVWTLTIELPPQHTAVEEQRAARARIGEALRAKGAHFDEHVITLSGATNRHQGDGLIQPQLWIGNAVSLLGENDDLYAGYVGGDSALRKRDALYRMFDAAQTLGRKRGRLILPLEYVRKVDVLRRLDEGGLAGLTWTCERPTRFMGQGLACGGCDPCTVLAKARANPGEQSVPDP
jgi:7-cyano-7-deazaguanine synthase in queuosine biosynthesis